MQSFVLRIGSSPVWTGILTTSIGPYDMSQITLNDVQIVNVSNIYKYNSKYNIYKHLL